VIKIQQFHIGFGDNRKLLPAMIDAQSLSSKNDDGQTLVHFAARSAHRRRAALSTARGRGKKHMSASTLVSTMKAGRHFDGL
jgi:hypothetical protein